MKNPAMKKIFPVLLCCTAVAAVRCVPSTGPLAREPEKSAFGYRIRVTGDQESGRSDAEQQASDFCKSRNKRYEFGRFVKRISTTMGMNIEAYDFYFTCQDEQTTKVAEPEKPTPKKSEASVRKETGSSQTELPLEKTPVPANDEVPVKLSGTTAEPQRTARAGGDGRPVIKVSKKKMARKKEYIPGEPERLAPPGEEKPVILDGTFIEETLDP
jgi:hypothetical protein